MDSNPEASPVEEARGPRPLPYDVFRVLVAHKQPMPRAGLEFLSGCLPESDKELHQWLEKAIATNDGLAFDHIICAAAMKERKLQASLLPEGAALIRDPCQRESIAWHMEGDVADGLVKAAARNGMSRPDRARLLFYAAAWWVKYREGPLPPALTTAARTLGRMKPVNGESAVTLAALIALAPNDALQDIVPCGRDNKIVANAPKIRDGFLELVEFPFHTHVPEKPERGYTLGRPMRRSTEDIGRNEPCPCGSGKKYKNCCISKGQERLSRSTDVAGKTDVELHDNPGAGLTAARLQAMPAHEMVRIGEMEETLAEPYLLRLAELNRYEEVVAFFEHNGVLEKWEEVWKRLFGFMVRAWQPEAARRLLKTHADPDGMLPKLEVGVRLMLSSNKKFLTTLEAEALAALQAEDLEALQQMASALTHSTYPALGIVAARGVIPLLENRQASSSLIDEILHARDRLNLSPEDALSDWLDEQSKEASEESGDEKTLELQEKVDAKDAEVRKLKEQLAEQKRKQALAEKKANRAEAATATATPSAADKAAAEELRRKAKTTEAILRERTEERSQLRRERDEALAENAKLRAAAAEAQDSDEDDDDADEGEPYEVSGNQPTRLIKFPRNFQAATAPLKAHVRRAGLRTIGHIASGDQSAFGGVKNLKAYHGVLEKRVAGRHRLLFTLDRQEVSVVALIPRGELDATVDHLQKHGLPVYG